MIYCARTDKGMVRTNNEDAFYLPEGEDVPLLFIVADGMGGHNSGEVASRMAVEEISSHINRSLSVCVPENACNKDCCGNETLQVIKEAFYDANMKIYRTSIEREECCGMGTTATMALFKDGKVYIGHVGDSRAYILRDEGIRQLTKDHSLVWQLFEEGRLTLEEVRCHPMKNVITRALGVGEKVEVDLMELEYKKGDIFLLCSDGLTNMLEDTEIRDIILDAKSLDAAADKLIEAANSNGGLDNITVEIVLVV
ncbi:Stp1/IreP family PP2C-type Ser/Thr phosphatase [Thermosediminibacter oceani]|uniref:Protein serine/threonine phosphatase n=1 Tax=Thermosediminibacter oceani (strain ATCC BAA-1034 / DSM 16646 / JW/IW-1228P) TaxID=555079 RepID=D9S316_THEOJ|nr:Stp1/IreP family PP2C-type Ser/Thr phosphatase [Thermosediminibacter oceani]ADL07793.1 protein serine/threonine phosphatase [Thermosediminibacter oceani DSM 16646]